MVSFARARHAGLPGLHLAPGRAVGAPQGSAVEAIVKEGGWAGTRYGHHKH